MANFPLTNLAVKMYCPNNNVVQLDDAGLPSLLVYIPKFKNSDVLNGGDDSTHPAFIVNGKEIDGFYYSKYQNVVHNGKAYSLPAEDPQTSVTFDEAREYCEAKGYGWHLSTAAEWAAIALWCMKNGFLPYGNNDYGNDNREKSTTAIPTYYNADGSIARVATGTGPLTWSHDGTASGIWDMNGNVWEWMGGIRLVWGELQILASNNAADPDNPQNTTSVCWKAINAADGTLTESECNVADTSAKLSGKTVRIDYADGKWKYCTDISNAENSTRKGLFGEITCATTLCESAKALLRSLALAPEDGVSAATYGNDQFVGNNASNECLVFRGGRWLEGVGAGVFTICGISSRKTATTYCGFRSVYIQNI